MTTGEHLTTGDQATITVTGQVVTLGLFPASSGYRYGCGDRTCRRFDLDGGHAWECQLTPVDPIEQPTIASAAFPHVGSEMTWTSPDRRAMITVRRGHFTWVVETYQGTLRMEDRCSAHPTEQAARSEARMWAELALAASADPAPAATQPPEQDPRRTVVARPLAKGATLAMSASQAQAIISAGDGGTIDRGAPRRGRLTDTQIRALAARGWVTPTVDHHGRREIITGCTPTSAGVQRAREILTRDGGWS